MSIENDERDGYGLAMEARTTRLEVAVEHIERAVKELNDDVRDLRAEINSIRTTDFRLIFGAIITVALGNAALMAKGFGWL